MAKYTTWVALLLFLATVLGSGCAGGDDDDSAADNPNQDVDDDSADDDVSDDDTSSDDDSEAPLGRIAVLSDLHFWYPEVELGDETDEPDSYPALLAHEALQYIRNEGPFIARAMILDAVGRGVKTFVLNGDYSDSQERAVYQAFAAELAQYENDYGVDFLVVRGNHDSMVDENHETGAPHTAPLFDGDLTDSWTYSIGALELFDYLRPFGLTASDGAGTPKDYIYWERGPETENGCGTIDPNDECVTQTQFSYLVEPLAGIWLLILDTNGFSTNGGESGWAGEGLKVAKPRTWQWLQGVYQRAAAQNKSVIAFGHHNLGDPLCGLTYDALPFLDRLIFDTKASTQELAKLGMGVYVSGHLHMDYVSRFIGQDSTLIDIQAPGSANFPVGYRLFTFFADRKVEVETVVVREVPDWDRYFDEYRAFAAVNDYSFEDYGVEQSATFGEYVDRSFEHMIMFKVTDVVGDGLIDLLKSISLYNLMLVAEAGGRLDPKTLDDGTWLSAIDPLDRAKAEESLDEAIEAAGLSVDEFKRLSLYDYLLSTISIQFGAAFALAKMAQSGSLDYYRFFMDRLSGGDIDLAAEGKSSEAARGVVSLILKLLSNTLREYLWERPYMGKVRIDLRDLSIAEIGQD